MCNAWNHPINCTCGWGGDGHAGRRTSGNGLPPPPILRFTQSYTNPNAHCPVCGASVFYYQSPNGGRVFFDELGPPWLKHPCTSQINQRSLNVTVLLGNQPTARTYAWQEAGWKPFFIDSIRELDRSIFEINGRLDTAPLRLYAIQLINRNSICQLKKLNDSNAYELSTPELNERLKKTPVLLYPTLELSRDALRRSKLKIYRPNHKPKSHRPHEESPHRQGKPKQSAPKPKETKPIVPRAPKVTALSLAFEKAKQTKSSD